jgi:hypothetical protein
MGDSLSRSGPSNHIECKETNRHAKIKAPIKSSISPNMHLNSIKSSTDMMMHELMQFNMQLLLIKHNMCIEHSADYGSDCSASNRITK